MRLAGLLHETRDDLGRSTVVCVRRRGIRRVGKRRRSGRDASDLTVRRFPRGRGSPAAMHTAQAASASAPSPDTMNTEARAPWCRPRPAGGGRACRDRWPDWSHSPDRTHRAKRSGEQRGADRGRPQHVSTPRQLIVPTLDHSLRLGARGAVGLQLCGASFDVEASCPNTHRASIGAPAIEVDPASVPAGP
jgi:hypothetical protein